MGFYWAIVGCTGLYWAVHVLMGLPCTIWAIQASGGLHWIVQEWERLHGDSASIVTLGLVSKTGSGGNNPWDVPEALAECGSGECEG